MENQNINSKKIEKEIIINDIANINKLISSSNEDTQNYLLFNESLFVNHNKWLDHVKSQLLQSLNSSNININILDMNYDDDILNLLKKISTPNNYRKNMNKVCYFAIEFFNSSFYNFFGTKWSATQFI